MWHFLCTPLNILLQEIFTFLHSPLIWETTDKQQIQKGIWWTEMSSCQKTSGRTLLYFLFSLLEMVEVFLHNLPQLINVTIYLVFILICEATMALVYPHQGGIHFLCYS